MKTAGHPLRLIAVIILLAAALFVANQVFKKVFSFYIIYSSAHDPNGSESYDHMIDRFRSEADEAVRESCKKNLPQEKEITQILTDTSGNNCDKWTAKATAEFYDPAGGVNLTNMFFMFHDSDKQLLCVNIPGYY